MALAAIAGPIAKFAATTIIGGVLNSIFGGGNSDEAQRNLERFLEILSGDFTRRVGDEIANAFNQQNLLTLKTHINATARHLRTFEAGRKTV